MPMKMQIVSSFKKVREALMNNGAAPDTKRMPTDIRKNVEPMVVKKTSGVRS